MKDNNDINETKFQDEVIIRGHNKPISKEWKANHFNNSQIHDINLFLYVQKDELVIGVEYEKGLDASTLGLGESMEVLASARHYESVGNEGVFFLVARRDTKY